MSLALALKYGTQSLVGLAERRTLLQLLPPQICIVSDVAFLFLRQLLVVVAVLQGMLLLLLLQGQVSGGALAQTAPSIGGIRSLNALNLLVSLAHVLCHLDLSTIDIKGKLINTLSSQINKK